MSRRGIAGMVVVALCSSGIARAQLDDPDTTAARRHFESGLHFYDHDDFRGALAEFEAARRVKPLPAFDYNIGRCRDRLEQYPEAIGDYQRYLAAAPDAPDAADVRARIDILKERIAGAAAVVAPKPVSPIRRPLFWGIAGGAAVVVIVVAVVIGLTVGGGNTTFPLPSLGAVRGN